MSESDGYEQPSIYGRPITGTDTSYLIRYYDGRTERREVKPND